MAIPRTPAQAAQQNNRDTGGRYATKQHGEADHVDVPAATPVPAGPSWPATRKDAHLFLASEDIRWELTNNDITSGRVPAMIVAGADTEVDVEGGKNPDWPMWVPANGDISEFVTTDDDGKAWFDVDKAVARFGTEQPDQGTQMAIKKLASSRSAVSAELVAARREYRAAAERVSEAAGQEMLSRLRAVSANVAAVDVRRDDDGDVEISAVRDGDGSDLFNAWDQRVAGSPGSSMSEQVAWLQDESGLVDEAAAVMKRGTRRTFTA